MAKIEPLSVWKNGNIYHADDLSLSIVHDDLSSSAVFYYRLSESPVEKENEEGVKTVITPGGMLADGNVSISGEDYIVWGEAEDVNQAAFVYVAEKLGLTLV